jgi:hypothetical protein
MLSISNGEAASSVRTKLNYKLGEVKNVKEYGALGNGSDNDATAIQAAVDDTTSPYSSAYRGVIFFPPGTYVIGSPITFPVSSGITKIHFVGSGGAKIIGNFADALLKRVPDSQIGPIYSTVSVQNLELENQHATGKAIMLHTCIGAKVVNCMIIAHIGVETYNSQATTVDTCSFNRADRTLASSVGIVAGNGTTVINCDFVSYGDGIRHQNVGLNVIGGRFEGNSAGIVLGVDEDGAVLQSSNVFISGTSMETNPTAIYVASVAGAVLSGVGCGVGENETCDYGIRINGGNNIVLDGCIVSTSNNPFTGSGIHVENGAVADLTCISTSSPSWSINSLQSGQFFNCNQPAVTYSNLPTAPRLGTIFNMTDGTGVSIGGTVSGGSGSDDYVLCRGASAWVRIA